MKSTEQTKSPLAGTVAGVSSAAVVGHLFASVITGFFGAVVAVWAFKIQPWQWNSAASMSCLIFAALFGGMALMFLILTRVHDAEADNLRRNIAASRRFAEDLIARAQAPQPKMVFGLDELGEAENFKSIDTA